MKEAELMWSSKRIIDHKTPVTLPAAGRLEPPRGTFMGPRAYQDESTRRLDSSESNYCRGNCTEVHSIKVHSWCTVQLGLHLRWRDKDGISRRPCANVPIKRVTEKSGYQQFAIEARDSLSVGVTDHYRRRRGMNVVRRVESRVAASRPLKCCAITADGQWRYHTQANPICLSRYEKELVGSRCTDRNDWRQTS